MSERITDQEYREQVRDIAREAAEECGYDSDDAREWIRESCDGHEWVIYTHKAQQILALSENDGAYIDAFGSEGLASGGTLNWSALAFCALEADVLAAYNELEAPEEDSSAA